MNRAQNGTFLSVAIKSFFFFLQNGNRVELAERPPQSLELKPIKSRNWKKVCQSEGASSPDSVTPVLSGAMGQHANNSFWELWERLSNMSDPCKTIKRQRYQIPQLKMESYFHLRCEERNVSRSKPQLFWHSGSQNVDFRWAVTGKNDRNKSWTL